MITATEIESYFDRLWPLCRSITGEGVRQTLSILSEIIPLEIKEIPSGTSIFDWTVPKEWKIFGATLVHESGEKILDFKDSNLHVLGYSQPIDTELDLEELKPHLYSIPELPDAIPYLTSYYESRWGSCLSHNQLTNLKPGKYKAVIDSIFFDGSMTLADCLLPGELKSEILISTYTCHPSMANNELSGPLLSAFLYKILSSQKKPKHSIRFTFAPETVGTIAYLKTNGKQLIDRVIGGLVISCVGNGHPYFYFVRSKQGTTFMDRVVEHVVHHSAVGLRVAEYNPILCSDLRQLCSPGFNLPMGALTRTLFSYGELYGANESELFKGYHTSLDNKSNMDFTSMLETLDIFVSVINTFNENEVFERTDPYCEPQLSKRDLYPTLSERKFHPEWKWVEQICTLLNYCDGDSDLFSIAERSNFSFEQLVQVAKKLQTHDLIRPKIKTKK